MFTQYVTLLSMLTLVRGHLSIKMKLCNYSQVPLCYSHFKWYMRCHVISQKVIYLYAFWELVVIDFFFPSYLCCSLLKFRYSKKATKLILLLIWHYILLTLITLLRVPYLCHFGSTSFVLPIWPKYGRGWVKKSIQMFF